MPAPRSPAAGALGWRDKPQYLGADENLRVRLYPGVPATVMFPTVERTAFNYLVGPLSQSFNRAFR